MKYRPFNLFLLSLLLTSALSSFGSEPSSYNEREGNPFISPFDLRSAPVNVLRKIEPALLKEAERAKGGNVSFIVYLHEEADLEPAKREISTLARRRKVVSALKETAERSQAELRAYLEGQKLKGKVECYTPYWIFNGLAVKGDLEMLLALAARPEVKIIRADRKRYIEEKENSANSLAFESSTTEWNIAKIRADLVWDALGVFGNGVVVANMDTGVDWQHPALFTKYRGYSEKGLHVHEGNWYCATDEGYLYPGDGHGHGTHVMGIMVGDDIGVATGAKWIAVKVFTNQGYAYDRWIHDGFQWILAPAGKPELAPDIVNNSWGSEESADETFRPDLVALRAAGIIPIFAAGNSGPGGGTINSPASLPEAIAVGATDQEDEVTSFSSRGPSPWGEVKPEVCAPGVNVRSSVPGGGYAKYNGTSMSAPHVSGLAALLLEAQPGLSVTQTEFIITSTAFIHASPIPNNDYGWGRIDAYNAVLSVARFGVLSGTVKSWEEKPLPGATIEIAPHGGDGVIRTKTDDDGFYSIALAPSVYDITAEAFGYHPRTIYGVEIITGATTTLDFSLSRKPTGILTGRVTEERTGRPLLATILVLNTPITATTNSMGAYTITLPVGIYEVEARSHAHRIGRMSDVAIEEGGITVRDFVLPTAPTILLVDSGAWYYKSEIGYFREALDDLNYLYDLWTIKRPFSTPSDVPEASDLTPYDVVIWSSPEDSPGYIGASSAITMYLTAGGALFLTGQDVGYWDGGGSGFFYAPYYRDYLKARYIRDDSGSRRLIGLSGEMFEGLELTIEGEGGANNQRYPDEIEVADSDYAASVVRYQDDGSGGQRVGLCLPYRVLYLSFGFEAINSEDARREVMERVIDWLLSPRQETGVELTPSTWAKVGEAGKVVTYTLRIRNTGEFVYKVYLPLIMKGASAEKSSATRLPAEPGVTTSLYPFDAYDLSVEGNVWQTTILDESFSTLLTNTGQIASCSSITIGVRVEIPPGTKRDVHDWVRLTARSRRDRSVAKTITLTTKTPASVLLVDDDRWYDQEHRYKAALEANGFPYDYWDIRGKGESPSLSSLKMYPIVVWFTSYDWYNTLSQEEEEKLSAHLEGGGRLFFSSQDYLYTNGLTDFGIDYLGVLTYTEDLTATVAIGVESNPVGDGLGPYELNYPYPNWSDAITPTVPSAKAFLGEHRAPIALAYDNPPFRSVFFSFPFEALDEASAEEVMGRVIGWLSWLGESKLEVDKKLARDGDTLTYSIFLMNDGLEEVSASLSNPIPPNTTYIPGSVTGGAIYDPSSDRISWSGSLAAGESMTFTYQVEVESPLEPTTVIENVASFGYVEHRIYFDRKTTTRVNAPDLSSSEIGVDKEVAEPGDVLTYTITLRNDGVIDAPAAKLENTIPSYTAYVPDSLWASEGDVYYDEGVISWTGGVGVGASVTITYKASVTTARADFSIVNVVYIDDGYGEEFERRVITIVPPYKTYFPIILKQ